MGEIVLHLGYPKTATSTLQSSVFEVLHRSGHIRYLGMGGFQNDATSYRRDFFVRLTQAMYLEGDDAFAETLPALQSAYDQAKSVFSGQGPLVLSNEHFLSSIWSSKLHGQRIFPARSACRLAQVFEGEEVSLVIGTRDLPDLLRSVYIQIRSNKSHVNHDRIDPTLEAYIERVCARCDFTSEMYLVEKNQKSYENAFGGVPLFELNFTEFIAHQRETMAKLVDFIGLPESACDCIDFPLAHKNEKTKTEQGTLVENIPAFLRPVARNDLISPWARRISNFGPFKRVRRKLLPAEEIPRLTPEQRRKIEQTFL